MEAVVRYERLKDAIAKSAHSCGRDPLEIHLIAVSKTQNVQDVLPIYEAGCRSFGENRLPEAVEKQARLPPGAKWHFIGPLQRKKVPKVVGHFTLIHSVDSYKLAKKISDVSEASGLITSILLQANISGEPTKQGLSASGWLGWVKPLFALPGISIEGLMTIAPLTDDKQVVRRCFSGLYTLRDQLQQRGTRPLPHLSMGMSKDYPIAIEEGATLLRIGSAIWPS